MLTCDLFYLIYSTHLLRQCMVLLVDRQMQVGCTACNDASLRLATICDMTLDVLGCCSGETRTRTSCPGQKETHRGRLYARLDGVCPRTRAQQHSALCGKSCFSPARKLPKTKKRQNYNLPKFLLDCFGQFYCHRRIDCLVVKQTLPLRTKTIWVDLCARTFLTFFKKKPRCFVITSTLQSLSI